MIAAHCPKPSRDLEAESETSLLTITAVVMVIELVGGWLAGSLAVAKEQTVSAGQTLCDAGQTGDATTPHLHFEMWVGGWRSAAGYPIDPLPYLEAWEHE